MPEAARITSVEAVEAFRADLLVYLEKARNVVDEVGEEVKRTHGWLQDDRGPHWAQQVKRRTVALQERQQELFSAQLGNFKHNIQAELVAVRRAKQGRQTADTGREDGGAIEGDRQVLRGAGEYGHTGSDE